MSGNQPEINVEDAVALKKALDEQAVQLQKALEAVELFKQKEQEQIAKARNADLVAAVEDKEQAEKLFKAVKGLEAEDFQAVVEVVKALTAKVDANGFFVETGAKTGEQVQKSALQAILAEKYNK